MKRLSMKDIANLAGVSTATVSRVINKQGGYNKKTEKKINDIIRKTGYSINPSAKALRTNISHSISIIIPDITNEYFSKITREIDKFFLEKGYSVLIYDTNENSKFEKLYLEDILNKKCDGVIFIASQKTKKAINDEFPIPIVYVDRSPSEAMVSVTSNNEKGGYLAAKELIDKGCKEILYVRDIHDTPPIIDRTKGFYEYIEKFNNKIRVCEIKTLPIFEETQKSIKEFHLSGKVFDGIFATNDMIALAAINQLKKHSISVPKDIKVVGFDDISIARLSYPSITTIKQNTSYIGEIAAKNLYRLMQGDKLKNRHIVVPVDIVVRDSTRA